MSKTAPIKDFLTNHARKKAVSFHMPGHKGQAIYRKFGYDDFLDNIMDCDITEITGADNLFQAEGILKESQELYSRLYDSKKSYLLINGTSGGIIAAILASVPKGKKLIMARNSHKSIFNALTLADIQPVYAYPEMVEKHGISGAISSEEIEALLKENPDAEAVILPSPNYYGICSDIESIAKIVHKYNKILIVDQAHGAHLKMFSRFGVAGFPKSAEESGADIVINSIHKTLASFTQSAILNLNSDRVSKDILEDKLQSIESTSPSYLLMASLDINGGIIMDHGSQLMEEWAENLNLFYEEAANIKGLEYIDKIPGFDWTKLNFGFGSLGISGDELEKLLLERNIFIELYTGDLLMCMTGIGNSRKDMETLISALREISIARRETAPLENDANLLENKQLSSFQRKQIFQIPKYKVRVPLLEAEGRVCASSIIPYPPGIPLVCPGEKFDKETLLYIKNLRDNKEKVIGVNESGEVLVGSNESL
jgi:lysine decarboxylase